MVRPRNIIIRAAGNAAAAADPAPYQWRRDGRTRDAALRAARLGTARPGDPPPRPRSRMTRAELLAEAAALLAAAQDTP